MNKIKQLGFKIPPLIRICATGTPSEQSECFWELGFKIL